ncbi:short-chain fatty acyl-CoA regulator family protein [Yoonia sp. R2-816]|uniref:short-chain fatty acyl-CoA regulator family protein n=1 Tax=Yoonia sp. R2-816 TaxID=3342638 RepID=UPI003729759A
MSARRLTGSRIRERRLDQGVRQVSLAEAVGISPSYLNLIEHNRRRIAGKLLGDIARVLDVDPALLTEGAESNLLDQMRAAAASFGETAEVARAEEFAARYPGWSGLIAAQARRIATLEERVQILSDRMAYDPQLAASLHDVISAVTAIRSTASILVGQEALDADWQGRFHRNIHDDSVRLASSSEALIAYLEAPQADAAGPATPIEQVEAYLAQQDHRFADLEANGADLEDIVAAAELPPSASKLLRTVGAVYQADAAALPRPAFEEACARTGYDPVRIAGQFDVPFAAVLRRLSTLSAEDGHPPMGLAVCDATGTLTFLKSVPGFTIPRFGGGCPLWPIFGAFARPAQPVRAEVAMPGPVVNRMLCYAVAEPVGVPQFDAPPALQSTMLVIPDQPTSDAAVLPVGVSCRICPRPDCASRREPAIAGVGAHSNL